MAKKQRNKDNMFSISKTNRTQESFAFEKFFKKPFGLYKKYSFNANGIESLKNINIIDNSFAPKVIASIPESTGKHTDVNLMETIVSILNEENVKFKLINVKFNSESLDSRFVYINDDVFLDVIEEDYIRRQIENSLKPYMAYINFQEYQETMMSLRKLHLE
jgi:hypothetical protein